jgi:hypothetical protein
MLSALPRKILSRLSGKFVSPQAILDEVGLRGGQSVLELGSPVGFFAQAALAKVGVEGSVYVAGPDNESLEAVSHYNHHENLHPVLLRDILAGKTVPLGGIDTAVLTNLLSNAIHPGEFCISINQYLRPGSEVILIDWDSKVEEVGPDPAKRVSREQAIKLMGECGLEFNRVVKTTGYHYGLVFHATGQSHTESDNLGTR